MLKQFLSSKASSTQANIALLILRIGIGIIMIPHGYQKLVNYAELENKFVDFMGLGKSISLSLTIGAELFCSVLLVISLFTRFSLLPLIIAILVAVLMHITEKYLAMVNMLFFTCCLCISYYYRCRKI